MTSFSWDKMRIKHKLSLAIITIIATTWFVYLLLFQPQIDQIEQLRTQYHIEHQQVKIIEDFLLVHPNPEQYIAELDKKLLHIDTMLPDNPEISTFLVQTEQLARECGLQLNYLKPLKIINKESHREYEMEISLIGNFNQAMNFLNKFEKKSRFVNVIIISMQANKDRLETKLSVKIYSFGLPITVNTNNNTMDK